MNTLFFKSNSSNCNNCENEILPPNNKDNNFESDKKFNFKKIKNNTFNSLHEVEFFLNNFSKFSKCIKLYKILK